MSPAWPIMKIIKISIVYYLIVLSNYFTFGRKFSSIVLNDESQMGVAICILKICLLKEHWTLSKATHKKMYHGTLSKYIDETFWWQYHGTYQLWHGTFSWYFNVPWYISNVPWYMFMVLHSTFHDTFSYGQYVPYLK